VGGFGLNWIDEVILVADLICTPRPTAVGAPLPETR
jgi:hypothetical protein